ncbi:hypothetical protein [Agrococcus sp. ProA11]|uniref:hypothetical protein n=1 Tax=Agrococcus chionoecetis TaxID=3153752 RepID=UPI0032611F4C
MTMRERYGWRDPAAHEWTAGDIAFGWLVGAGVLLAGSLVVGVVMAGSAAVIVMLFGAIIGLPTLTVYGIPVAIAAASALRRVRNEFVHVIVFALLGALGGALAGLASAEPVGSGWAIVTPMIVVGAVTAVLARALAHDRAMRTRGA